MAIHFNGSIHFLEKNKKRKKRKKGERESVNRE
jgi:hypothetical protein